MNNYRRLGQALVIGQNKNVVKIGEFVFGRILFLELLVKLAKSGPLHSRANLAHASFFSEQISFSDTFQRSMRNRDANPYVDPNTQHDLHSTRSFGEVIIA